MCIRDRDETHPITRENILDEKVTITGRDGESKEVAIGDFATLEESEAPATIAHENSQKTVTTVSYTHLDVYKRQGMPRALWERRHWQGDTAILSNLSTMASKSS